MLVRYAGLDKNDIVNGKGFCVSFWTQYCPHKCKGCHNSETWDRNGGVLIEYSDLISQIIKSINANGILRNLSILGGEPLCKENIELVNNIINDIKNVYPNILIYCWTGYTFEELIKNNTIRKTLSNIDILIDGKFILEQRDITLKLRGSKNQRIIKCKQSVNKKELVLYE